VGKGKSRAVHDVARATAEAEENVVWKVCNGIFRPVKSERFLAQEAAAGRRGLPDPRAGMPTHVTGAPRVTNPQFREMAGELGYTEVPRNRWPRGAKPGALFFEKPGGRPPFISGDLDGHGAARDAALPGSKVSWKGADDLGNLTNANRSGTYVPEYGADGGISFQRKKR
jgi:hypothetical protein